MNLFELTLALFSSERFDCCGLYLFTFRANKMIILLYVITMSNYCSALRQPEFYFWLCCFPVALSVRGSLHSASFCIKQHNFVEVRPFVYMTTECWQPETANVWDQVWENNLLKLQPSFRLCKLANRKANDSSDNANSNASASQCIPLYPLPNFD